MTYHYWRYQIQSSSTLNYRSGRKEFEGALVRVGDGFGCIHPWPELGDDSLDLQLDALKYGLSTPIIDQALRCASLDGEARREGRSLFAGPVPQSHWLVQPGDDPQEVRERGYHIAKIKIGNDMINEVEIVRRWAAAEFRVRLDANETLSVATFLEFWYSLGWTKGSVELVEDPTEWTRDRWNVLVEVGVPIAIDRDVEERFEPGAISVVKPALTSWVPPESSRFFVTSYMDHALGQVWAASQAAFLASGPAASRMMTCGLLTHDCFAPDPFFERLEVVDGRLQAPEGTGLGFDDLLEGLPWTRLG